MAYKLIWSPASRDDLHDIVSYISRDSHQRAEVFGYRLIAETDKLKSFRTLVGLVLNMASRPSARSLFDLTELYTA
jgi:plasmid stabilization system protein ParE